MAQDTSPLPIPLTRWYGDPTNALALRDCLSNPMFRVAQATLLDVAMPSITGMPMDVEARALRHAWLAGYRDAFRDLDRLTHVAPKPEEDPQKNMLEEWGHVVPPSRIPNNT